MRVTDNQRIEARENLTAQEEKELQAIIEDRMNGLYSKMHFVEFEECFKEWKEQKIKEIEQITNELYAEFPYREYADFSDLSDDQDARYSGLIQRNERAKLRIKNLDMLTEFAQTQRVKSWEIECENHKKEKEYIKNAFIRQQNWTPEQRAECEKRKAETKEFDKQITELRSKAKTADDREKIEIYKIATIEYKEKEQQAQQALDHYIPYFETCGTYDGKRTYNDPDWVEYKIFKRLIDSELNFDKRHESTEVYKYDEWYKGCLIDVKEMLQDGIDRNVITKKEQVEMLKTKIEAEEKRQLQEIAKEQLPKQAQPEKINHFSEMLTPEVKAEITDRPQQQTQSQDDNRPTR